MGACWAKLLGRKEKEGETAALSPVRSDTLGIYILAIGASLTEGYYLTGSAFHPYTLKLQQLAKQHKVEQFEVVNKGVSGEQVVPDMVARLDATLAQARTAGRLFTHVFILAGNGDLAKGRDSEMVFKGLQHMYQAGVAHGAHVVAMTLPGYQDPEEPALSEAVKRTGQLNSLIKQYVEQGQKKASSRLAAWLASQQRQDYVEGGKLSLVDVEALLAPKRPDYWDDSMHLIPEGYDLIGQQLWEDIVRPALPAARA